MNVFKSISDVREEVEKAIRGGVEVTRVTVKLDNSDLCEPEEANVREIEVVIKPIKEF